MQLDNEPYALKEPAEKQRRIAMLDEPYIAKLSDYVNRMKAEHPDKRIPYFDPCDGGVNAKALFLMEAPGPKAIESGFISRNNPDPTARNVRKFWEEVGIARSDSVFWNIVPWYVGTDTRIREVGKSDIPQSSLYLKELLSLLPKLKVIALVGLKAQSATSQIRQLTQLPIENTPHPSGRNLNSRLYMKTELREQLRVIAALINDGQSKQA